MQTLLRVPYIVGEDKRNAETIHVFANTPSQAAVLYVRRFVAVASGQTTHVLVKTARGKAKRFAVAIVHTISHKVTPA